MSFKKSLSKPTPPSASKHGGASTGLGSFSFRQLDNDEGEDLSVYAGISEKRDEDTEKVQKNSHKRTSSSSSISSVSSASGDVTLPVRTSFEEMVEIRKTPLKPNETTGSALRSAARAKFETSIDIFSGLKGKITDRISRTIEEFSGDFNPSPDKEKPKLLPLQNTHSHPLEDKMADSDFYVSTPVLTQLHSSAPVTESNVLQEVQERSSYPSLEPIESPLPFPENISLSVKDLAAASLVRNEDFFESHKETISRHSSSSDIVETHARTKSNADGDLEDVGESPEVGLLPSDKQNIDDSPGFYHSQSSEPATKIIELGDFTSEPAEDFMGNPKSLTDFQVSPSPKIKHLRKKNEPKMSAFAAKSELHQILDDHSPFFLEGKHKDLSKQLSGKQELNKSDQDEKSSVQANANPISPIATTTRVLLKQLNIGDRILPYQKMITVAVVLFSYFIIPLPSYISGLIMGALLASLGWALYMWLTKQAQLPGPTLLPQLDKLPPVPELKVTTEGEALVYKGWMNELTDYDADNYHINKTHSIFVSLEGTHLRMQRPKTSVPKRAMWDEVLPKPQFVHQRHFYLPGSKVFLLPHGLVKKRIWSKKYPICVSLAERNSSDDSKLKHASSEPIVSEKKSKISEMGFEIITEEKCSQNILYLFARTGREKEDWFKRLYAAASGKPLANHVLEMKRVISQSSASSKKSVDNTQRHKREGSTGSTHSSSSETQLELSSHKEGESLDLLTFAHYMGRLMPSGTLSGSSSPAHNSTSKDVVKASFAKETNKNSRSKDSEDEVHVLSPGSPVFCDSQMFWVNALIGRCFFDFLRDKWWINKVKEKLQGKLSKIHVPYFIEELQVTDIHMGSEVPGIRHASKPYIDEQGFWVNLDITYAGGFQMTIETKINLMKLKKTSHVSSHSGHSVDSLKSPITNSEEEDSAESSTDSEEEAPSTSEDSSSGGGASKKLLRYLNKITQSKYFQQATEYKVIKRAMENVSNTPLTLSVTLVSLVGKLAVNIPPPPSDRLWYGFRNNPHLRLSAKPHVGERAVTITHIVEWIEKKLATEFQRVFVMPNMDDLVIPILVPGEMNQSTTARSSSL